jgi:hypothetical protein
MFHWVRVSGNYIVPAKWGSSITETPTTGQLISTNGNSCERLVPMKEYCTGSLIGTNGNSCERLVPMKEYCTGSLIGTNGNSCEQLVPMKEYCSGCSHSSVPL